MVPQASQTWIWGYFAIPCRSSQALVMLDGGSSLGSHFQDDEVVDNLKPKESGWATQGYPQSFLWVALVLSWLLDEAFIKNISIQLLLECFLGLASFPPNITFSVKVKMFNLGSIDLCFYQSEYLCVCVCMQDALCSTLCKLKQNEPALFINSFPCFFPSLLHGDGE